MTKKLVALLLVLAIILILPASTPVDRNIAISAKATQKEESIKDLAYKVMKTRFENMLNNNYLYNDDFSSDKTIIENSTLALLDKSVDGEIDKGLVLNFINGMYGLNVNPNAADHEAFPASEGMLAIIPRGYSEYKHSITSIKEVNGEYIVYSDAKILNHDYEEYASKVVTVFKVNAKSSFGYNIVSSKILW